MKKYLFWMTLSVVLLGCSSSSLSSLVSSSSETSSSSSDSSNSSTSLASSTSLSTSSSSSAVTETTVASKWLVSLGIAANTYAQIKPTIPTTLSTRGVIDMIHVQTYGLGETVGVAFEARVRGNVSNFTFRLGILNGKFGAFETVSENEHGEFGKKVFTALRNGLAGKDATYENILATYVQQGLDIQTAQVTQTLEEMMPSFNAMLNYYDTTINV